MSRISAELGLTLKQAEECQWITPIDHPIANEPFLMMKVWVALS